MSVLEQSGLRAVQTAREWYGRMHEFSRRGIALNMGYAGAPNSD